jgi:hypothetical protein
MSKALSRRCFVAINPFFTGIPEVLVVSELELFDWELHFFPEELDGLRLRRILIPHLESFQRLET